MSDGQVQALRSCGSFVLAPGPEASLHAAAVKVHRFTSGSQVGLCWQLRFSLSALLFLLFVHCSIITDILKGFPFWSSFVFCFYNLGATLLFSFSSQPGFGRCWSRRWVGGSLKASSSCILPLHVPGPQQAWGASLVDPALRAALRVEGTPLN